MKTKILSLLALLLSISACETTIQAADPNPTPHDVDQGPGVFSENGNLLENFKGFSFSDGSASNTSSVNSYLWRAALESVSFMPLIQADSAGGVILSDWIMQQDDENKQVKVDIFIYSKKLDPNALKVKVFNRTKEQGQWSTAISDPVTAEALEETILSKARTLRIKANAIQ